MPKTVSDTMRELLINSIESAAKNLEGGGDHTPGPARRGGIGARGMIAGLGAAAVAPAAIKGLGRLAREAGMNGVTDLIRSPGEAVEGLTENVGASVSGKVSEKVDEAGGPSGILSGALKGALPFGDGDGDDEGGDGGVGIGSGRRIPVQQSVDIAAPLETVYNQWTQFEEWPRFMHRVVRVTQEDDTSVSFVVRIWSRTREFTATIETQRPDERVRWQVSQGMTHAGLVSFHEIAPNLTRVLLSLDVEPGGLIEKLARGLRHVKRAARGDLHRFKAFVELAERETGAWRGTIEDGEVAEEHDPKYDDDHDYADADAVIAGPEAGGSGDDAGEDEGDGDGDEPEGGTSPPRRRRRSSNGHGHDDDGASSRTRARSRSATKRSSRSRSSKD